MVRKSKVIIIHEHIVTGEKCVSVSGDVFGDLSPDEIFDGFKDELAATKKSIDSVTDFHIKKILQDQKTDCNITYTVCPYDGFEFNSNMDYENKTENVYDYVYIINHMKETSSIKINSEQMKEMKPNILMLFANSAVIIEAVPYGIFGDSKGGINIKPTIKYEIERRTQI